MIQCLTLTCSPPPHGGHCDHLDHGDHLYTKIMNEIMHAAGNLIFRVSLAIEGFTQQINNQHIMLFTHIIGGDKMTPYKKSLATGNHYNESVFLLLSCAAAELLWQ